MREILPGVFHWTAFHPGIGLDVSSYFVEPAGTLIDPMVPAEGVDWFRERRAPELIVLTCRHHYRHSDRFREEFGLDVCCNEAGLHEFEGGPEVDGYTLGDELAPGIRALEMNVISPDETALHLRIGDGALALADGLVNWGGGELGFFPDEHLGEDPEQVKLGLRASLKRLAADEEFESVLFAHGEPLPHAGRQALARFLDGP
jgi:hypothetical protein